MLALIPESKAALENVNVFKKAWVDQVKTFMDAVDDIISVQDFLSVVENHILEDVKVCCKAMQVIETTKDSGHLLLKSRFSLSHTLEQLWLIFFAGPGLEDCGGELPDNLPEVGPPLRRGGRRHGQIRAGALHRQGGPLGVFSYFLMPPLHSGARTRLNYILFINCRKHIAHS